MNFDFISDDRFKELIVKDYGELQSSFESQLSKSTLILAGSIIEASLLEHFIQYIPNGETEAKLLKYSLNQLISLANSEGLLTKTEMNLASVINDYRNLIHPGRQIRKKEKYDFKTATIAYNLVGIIIDAIRLKHQSIVGFSAEEIIDKLRNDWNFKSIYSKVIIKLKHPERNKLFDLLLEHEMEDKEDWEAFMKEGLIVERDYHELEEVKPLISELKPLLQSEFIQLKLNELLHEIQKGDSLRAYSMFNLLHEDIDKLKEEEQEIIAIYILKLFESVLDHYPQIAFEKTYSTIGKYINSKHGLKAFKDFTVFCIVHFTETKFNNPEIELYEQAFNSLSEEQKLEIQVYMDKFLFEKGQPPKNVMDAFVECAYQRGILIHHEIMKKKKN